MQANVCAIMANRPVEPANRVNAQHSAKSFKQSFSKTLDKAAVELTGEDQAAAEAAPRTAETKDDVQVTTCVDNTVAGGAEKEPDGLVMKDENIHADSLVNPSQTDNMLQQLMEILQMLGLPVDAEPQGTAAALGEAQSNAGQNPGGQIISMRSLERLLSATGDAGISGIQLKQALQQLIRLLSKSGGTGPEMEQLKSLVESQLEETTALPVKDFLSKLVETINKLAEKAPVEKAPVEAAAGRDGQHDAAGQVVSGDKPGTGRSIEPLGRKTVEPNPAAVVEEVAAKTDNPGEKQTEDAGFGSKEPKHQLVPDKGTEPFNGQEHSKLAEPGKKQRVSGESVHFPRPQVSEAQESIQMPRPSQVAQSPRLTQEVFGQIVQKAKLLVTPDLSEVKIQLKPDFLGKLNLTVTSENGKVTAKFNAENYRVKEIIEANLNTLKDALAEQGLKVDQLLVSTGSERNYSGLHENKGGYFHNNFSKGARTNMGQDELDSRFLPDSEVGAVRQYYGSTVDFKA